MVSGITLYLDLILIMAKVSTTSMGREHEEHIAGLFEWDSAKRSRSSGASPSDPIDITSQSLVVECECTDSDSWRGQLLAE